MNQSPQTEKQTGKRIVSKGEYARKQGRRLWLGLKSCAALLCLPALLVVGYFQQPASSGCIQVDPRNGIGYRVFIALFFVPASIFAAKQIFRDFQQIDPGVPLTRANTADLPAPDSLVRASEEPMQEQQAVLLRAAAQRHETSPEQLVRPTAEV
jgi:hypothetical protein